MLAIARCLPTRPRPAYRRRYSMSVTLNDESMSLRPSPHAPPDTPRNRRLLEIYQPVRQLGIGSSSYYESLRAATAFKTAFPLFKDYSTEHAEFLVNNHLTTQIPRSRTVHRIDVKLAHQLTEWSCKLEGNTLAEADLAAFLPEKALEVDPSNITPFLQLPPIPRGSKRTEDEYKEVYSHFVALYFAQELMAKHTGGQKLRDQLPLTLDDITSIHSVLMFPFPQKVPGEPRRYPIRVNSHELAVFPYPIELPTLLADLCEWTASPVSAHPVLFAADLFLNFTHLHPFNDGNGRLGRILFNMALAKAGYHPIPFAHAKRSQYLDVVYEAQQNGDRSQFYTLVLDELNSLRPERQPRQAHW